MIIHHNYLNYFKYSKHAVNTVILNFKYNLNNYITIISTIPKLRTYVLVCSGFCYKRCWQMREPPRSNAMALHANGG